ncbi:hypothetical protein F5X98DRAFT_384961 [Xylaria grammica]|nr:hypothetical protein F5X98DRAFT_384961 [Xylaria grammica]
MPKMIDQEADTEVTVYERSKENSLVGERTFSRLFTQRFGRKPEGSDGSELRPNSSPEDDEDEGVSYVTRAKGPDVTRETRWNAISSSSSPTFAWDKAATTSSPRRTNADLWTAERLDLIVVDYLHVRLGPIMRLIVGFFSFALSIAYGTVAQKLFYNSSPCYNFPTQCGAAAGGPNDINSVWIQFPAYSFIALGQILAITTAYKLACGKAPDGVLLQLAISPTAQNPKLVVLCAALAAVMFAATLVFAAIYRKDDRVVAFDDPIDEAPGSQEEKSPEMTRSDRYQTTYPPGNAGY